MPFDPDIIAEQFTLLAIHRRTLTHLLEQAAQFGGEVFAPPQTANGIADVRANIRRVKTILGNNGVTVDDHPDDDPPIPNQVLPAIRRAIPSDQITFFERLMSTIRQLIIQQNCVSEIKNIHNLLHNLKSSLNTVGPYIRTTKIKRKKLDFSFVEIRWKISIVGCLQNLRDFASKDLKYMGPILVVTESEILGPRWIVGLINIQLNIQTCLNERSFSELYDLWEELEGECDKQMIEIDKELLAVVNKIERLTNYILGVIGDDPAI